jgi:penicillin-binding protein 2
VEALEHPELEIEVGQRRLYRHRYQTAHILGYLGEVEESELATEGSTYRPGDLVGKKGLERRYESLLRGERGEQMVVVDSRGRRVEEIDRSPADAGQDLYLTLDLDLQQEAWGILEGRVGSIVALDPRQGDILAMVSSPSFDPNMFARRLRSEEWQALIENPDRPLQNRAIQNVYPPGSVFKMVMAMAALDRGFVDPDRTKVWCPGHSLIYNNVYRCWKAGGHGTVDLRRALEGSCNVYFHRLGQELEIDRIAETALRFGLGSKTGIDLEGEKGGLVPSQEWSERARRTPWYPGETISVATGQGPILVTPLQVAVMTAVFANGGYLVTPRLYRDASTPPPKDLGFSPEDLEVVREGLWKVVQGTQGTGYRAKVAGVEIAGKTGTAQVITQERRTDNDDLPEKLRDHAWFTSFAPYDDPRLVVVIFVEHGGAGSSTAAPLARALYERFLETDLAPHRSAG